MKTIKYFYLKTVLGILTRLILYIKYGVFDFQ